MNPKIQRIVGEIDRAKAVIAEKQARVRELERQKTELENADLVAAMRGMKATPGEFEAFLAAKRQRNAAPADTQTDAEAEARENPAPPVSGPYQTNQEDSDHEE
jgi:hypothetical protein